MTKENAVYVAEQVGELQDAGVGKVFTPSVVQDEHAGEDGKPTYHVEARSRNVSYISGPALMKLLTVALVTEKRLAMTLSEYGHGPVHFALV